MVRWIEIQQQGNQPMEIQQISSSQKDNGVEIKGIKGTGDLSALEKLDKLNAQYVELYQ
jgi:hypothetical protein